MTRPIKDVQSDGKMTKQGNDSFPHSCQGLQNCSISSIQIMRQHRMLERVRTWGSLIVVQTFNKLQSLCPNEEGGGRCTVSFSWCLHSVMSPSFKPKHL